MDEETLDKMALEEIMKDIKRGAERAQEYGALGWQKSPVPPPNKTFLRNMLMSTLTDRTRTISRSTSKPHAITDHGLYINKQRCIDCNSSRDDSFSATRKPRVEVDYSGGASNRKRKQRLHQKSTRRDSHTSSQSCGCRCKFADSADKRPDDDDSDTKDETESTISVGSHKQMLVLNKGISSNENHLDHKDKSRDDGTRDRISGQDSRTQKDSHSTKRHSKKHSNRGRCLEDTDKKPSELRRYQEDSSKRERDDKDDNCHKKRKTSK